MPSFKIEHGECYGHGCSGCMHRGWLHDEDAEMDYADYAYEDKRDRELMEELDYDGE